MVVNRPLPLHVDVVGSVHHHVGHSSRRPFWTRRSGHVAAQHAPKVLLLLAWVHAPVLGNATTDAMPAAEFTLGPATAPLYAYAPTIVRSASFDVVEPAVGRKPRAIIQTASPAKQTSPLDRTLWPRQTGGARCMSHSSKG
jgi:hypothetical protein